MLRTIHRVVKIELIALDLSSCINNVLLSVFTVAGVLGFAIGKMSYIGECQKKFQKIGGVPFGPQQKRFVLIYIINPRSK